MTYLTASTETTFSDAYEQAIPTTHRLLHGQYYTPWPVCDLMLALSLQANVDSVLEPGCGAGNFLLRISDYFNRTKKTYNNKPVIKLTGIELDAQAAELARAQLSNPDAGLSIHIQVANFLSPEVDLLGPFDAIIGNPPYVRQEHVLQSDKKTAVAYLASKYSDYLERWPQQKRLFAHTTDLYIWFFLQATTLLKPGGKLTFITSNSWLNTDYGQLFREFLLHHFHIRYLVESACERWFKDAAVNPLIIVLEKKEEVGQYAIPGEPCQLIRIGQPLAQWMPKPDHPEYWQQLQNQIRQWQHDTAITVKTFPLTTIQNTPLSRNWALALRAPRLLSTLLEQDTLWISLETLGQVRYPLKTGINRFFYLSGKQAEQWRLEPEFLHPVIRSTRNITQYTIRADECSEYVFSCPLTITELETQGKTGALAYIRWGETQTSPPRQKRANPTPWPNIPSVQSNRPWYSIKPLAPPQILCNRFIDQRFFFAQCQGPLMEDQTFYGFTLSPTSPYQPELIAGLLNSTLSYLVLEFNARTNLGEGVLQYARGDMANFPLINPAHYQPDEQARIMAAFQVMSQRKILPIEEERFQTDRMALDQAVLTPILKRFNFDMDALALRERLVSHLLDRVQERTTLARSVRKK